MSLEASGKETRGAGTASADVPAVLAPDPAGTLVKIHTAMNVTGRPAQFGRGVMVEVGGKLIDQFADNLAKLLAGGGVADASATTSAAAAAGDRGRPGRGGAGSGRGFRRRGTAEPAQQDSLNLLKLVGPSILKRAVPVIVAAAGVTVGAILWRRRGKKASE